MDTELVRQYATDAIRYWEPRRILYNAVLAVVVGFYFVLGLPESKNFLAVNSLLILFLLAVLANVAYCAAYPVDVFVQASGFRERWLKYRWVLFFIGVAFAAVVTRFWALAFFSPVSH